MWLLRCGILRNCGHSQTVHWYTLMVSAARVDLPTSSFGIFFCLHCAFLQGNNHYPCRSPIKIHVGLINGVGLAESFRIVRSIVYTIRSLKRQTFQEWTQISGKADIEHKHTCLFLNISGSQKISKNIGHGGRRFLQANICRQSGDYCWWCISCILSDAMNCMAMVGSLISSGKEWVPHFPESMSPKCELADTGNRELIGDRCLLPLPLLYSDHQTRTACWPWSWWSFVGVVVVTDDHILIHTDVPVLFNNTCTVFHYNQWYW